MLIILGSEVFSFLLTGWVLKNATIYIYSEFPISYSARPSYHRYDIRLIYPVLLIGYVTLGK